MGSENDDFVWMRCRYGQARISIKLLHQVLDKSYWLALDEQERLLATQKAKKAQLFQNLATVLLSIGTKLGLLESNPQRRVEELQIENVVKPDVTS